MSIREKIYLKYKSLFKDQEEFYRLVEDIPKEEHILSIERYSYIEYLLESRVISYIKDNIKRNNYQMIRDYIDRESKDLESSKTLEFLGSIEVLLRLGGVYINDRLLKRLVEDNISLINICGRIVKNNSYYFHNGIVKEVIDNPFTRKLLYSYCDLMEIDISNMNSNIYYKGISLDNFSSKEEEYLCIRKAREGDKTSIEEIVRRYIKMVYKMAFKYKSNYNEFGDLVNQGVMGILRSINSFDDSLGVRFSTYVEPWIKTYIVRYLDRYSGCIRVSYEYRKIYRRYNELMSKYYLEEERVLKIGEASKILNVKEEILENVISIMDFKLCLDSAVNTNQGVDVDLVELIKDESIDLERDYELLERNNILRKVIEDGVLSPKEKKALLLKYGFLDDRYLTSLEVSKKLGLTRQRIDQLVSSGISKLRSDSLLREYFKDDKVVGESLREVDEKKKNKLVRKKKK